MDRFQAISVVRDTFTQRFDDERFTNFTRNLLNHLDESKKQTWTLKKAAFEDYVNHFSRLGTYTDPRGERLDVLAIHLRKNTTLARGRVTLRNFVADYLATGHGQGKAAVIAAFVSPSEDDWRFSFVKLDYTLEKTELGMVTERAQLTPARRYSYLVGKNENCHTAQKQFLELLQTDTADPTLAQLETSFSVEKVTREFYDQYKDLFEKTRDALKVVLKDQPSLASHFDERGIDNDDFAKKLLGQIVFLYFLQKKGWFGVEPTKAWGTGRKDFIRHLFRERAAFASLLAQKAKRTTNFFNDILEPLFYEALAIDRSDNSDHYSLFDCKIPFLNGGLFEPIYGYQWQTTDILLPDTLFSNDETNNEGDVGTGILDVFDRYNFTVNEAEPLEKEVAVDPEMLGKVFENLLPENIRHASGTYYTPRVIVHYMCQQALLNYLAARSPHIPQNDLALFLRHAERFADFEAKDKKSYAERGLLLPETISQYAPQLDDLLSTITVCDPAIGSGAFPVGMMHEIVRARIALSPALEKSSDVRAKKPRTAYVLKRDAIQYSLYGVDLDPGAVEIAKLRLWLSMVVDEDEISHIQPLPNLDYKIMQGNSLLEEFDGVRLLDEKLLQPPDAAHDSEITEVRARITAHQNDAIRRHREGKKGAVQKLTAEREIKRLQKRLDTLVNPTDAKVAAQGELNQQTSWASLKRIQELHSKFFDENSRAAKDRLRKELDGLEWNFMEATLREQGREQAIVELKRASARHRKPFFLWRLHFAEVFQQRGGFDVVIGNPPYVLVQAVGQKGIDLDQWKRLYVTARYKVDLYQLFIEAGIRLTRIDGAISFITPNSFLKNKHSAALREFILSEMQSLSVLLFYCQVFPGQSVDNSVFVMRRRGLTVNSESAIRSAPIRELTELNTLSVWRSTPIDRIRAPSFAFELDVNEKLAALLDRIDSTSYPLGNVCDAYFGIQTFDRKQFVSKRKESDSFKPVIDGTNVRRWSITGSVEFVDFRPQAIKSGGDSSIYKRERIVVRQIGEHPEGSICPPGMLTLNTIYNIFENNQPVGLRFLLGVINSTTTEFYWRRRFFDNKETFPKIKKAPILAIRVPRTDERQKRTIETLVEYLLWLHKEVLPNENVSLNSSPALMADYFDQWVNALVCELFFSEPLHAAGLHFFRLAEQAELPALPEIKGEELATLGAIFEELYATNHPLRQGLFGLDSIEEIRIIEGKA